MFDIGWSELLLIGVVALIVVGPKDLPVMFHTLGRVTARARQMAREFSRAMEEAAKDTGLDGAASDLKSLTSKKSLGLEALERATEKFEKWDPKFPGQGRASEAKLQPDPGYAEDLAGDLDAAEADFEPELPGDAAEAAPKKPAYASAEAARAAAAAANAGLPGALAGSAAEAVASGGSVPARTEPAAVEAAQTTQAVKKPRATPRKPKAEPAATAGVAARSTRKSAAESGAKVAAKTAPKPRKKTAGKDNAGKDEA